MISKMNKKTGSLVAYNFLLGSILSQAIAVYFGKLAATQLQGMDVFDVLFNSYYIMSLVCLMIQAFFWHLTLKRLELSIAYPSTAILFIFIILISYYFFNESISINNVIGILIMMVGIIIINK
ncbi:EamA family transporter [Paenibacillus eucommiae]|uniref:Multidrug transporter EmrE-like cation transporter n=1 Tax=Paenibacillus eucommiae TaxID=1355755 RepID=A0ABS4IU86_9BACL|nr:EamA family transporter [Paenibacillus eucommiae]MBP1991137.1 multidrug transporter EmrE-like cation transporter [Paenibacillus eucommiae]